VNRCVDCADSLKEPVLSPLKVMKITAHFGVLVTLLMGCAAGCTTVKPWQRGTLADPIMQPDRDPQRQRLIDHVYFSREAASGGRSVGGAGCGCN